VKKYRITIRTKLIISHCVAILLISGSIGTYFYLNASQSLMRQIQDRLQYSAALMSRTIDAGSLEGIEGSSDTGTAAYRETLRQLRDFRRTNSDIAFLYIMRKVGDEVRFVIDSDETDKQALPGMVYTDVPPNLYEGFDRMAVDAKIYEDKWGAFLSGYAPLMNGRGQYLVGIDMRADEVGRKFHLLRISAAVSLIASIVLAFLFSKYLSHRFTSPLAPLISRCRAIAEDRLADRLDFTTNDEFNDLITAFNTMCTHISASEKKKKEAFEALRKSRDELDIRVEQRTQDLKEINKRLRIAIKERIRAQAALEEAAMIDPLTGVLNRRGMMTHLQHHVARNQRNGVPFTILMVDLDHFKAVNDTYGHETGDLVLRKTAMRLASSTRSQDIVSRWGGEEFLILLSETAADGGKVVAERIRQRIAAEPFPGDGKALSVTASIGGAAFEKNASIDECIRRADVSLYKAKYSGRNSVEFVLTEEILPSDETVADLEKRMPGSVDLQEPIGGSENVVRSSQNKHMQNADMCFFASAGP